MNRLALSSWGQDQDFRPSCRLHTSDQVRSLWDNTGIQGPRYCTTKYSHTTVQPPWSRHCTANMVSHTCTVGYQVPQYCKTKNSHLLYNPNGHVHCIANMASYTVPTKYSHTSVQGSRVTPLYSRYGPPTTYSRPLWHWLCMT